MYIVPIQLGIHLRKRFSRQVDVQKIVVTQVHQRIQGIRLTNRQGCTEALEKPFNEEVVFEQPTAATPFELA